MASRDAGECEVGELAQRFWGLNITQRAAFLARIAFQEPPGWVLRRSDELDGLRTVSRSDAVLAALCATLSRCCPRCGRRGTIGRGVRGSLA
jgi:hypothetical protein